MKTLGFTADQLRFILPICASVIGSSFAVGAWLNATVTSLQNDQRQTNIALEALSKDLERLRSTTLTLPMAAEAALRQAIENPGLRVPDPRNPQDIIVVNKSPVGFNGGGP